MSKNYWCWTFNFRWLFGAVRLGMLWGMLWGMAACAASPTATRLPPASSPASSAGLFPDDWAGCRPQGEVAWYDANTLFDLVDGQADAFFAYGFERVGVRRYACTPGGEVRVHLWQLASPTDAFGLFTTNIAGQPAAVGNEGDMDAGLRLVFWQDRYFVQIWSSTARADAELIELGQTLARGLPSGGQRPAIMEQLPQDGLVERTAILFRQEISIQSWVWLGGENLLGLSAQTEGVLAQYNVQGGPVYLLLIQYPAAAQAAASLAALRGGDVTDLLAADARGVWLGAVIGQADPSAAQTLLEQGLGR